jgi:hypothetical protein
MKSSVSVCQHIASRESAVHYAGAYLGKTIVAVCAACIVAPKTELKSLTLKEARECNVPLLAAQRSKYRREHWRENRTAYLASVLGKV